MPIRRLLALVALLLSVAPLAGAQAPGVKRFTEVALSPDGRRVAWIGPASRSQSVRGSGGVIADRNTNWAPTVIVLPTADTGSAAELAWSADGRQLAVIATANHTPSLFVYPADGGPPRRVMTTTGSVHDLRWSPDGTHIAILYSLASEQANSPIAPTPRDTGVMDTHIDRQHLGVVDVATGTVKPVSPADLYIYEYDWSPNGKQLVVSQARGSGNNNWWVARLSVIDASTAAIREVAAPKTQIANPRWSPNGSEIAYIGGIMSDQGATGGDLYVVSANGGTPKNLTPAITSSIASFSWTGGSKILATGYAQGRSQISNIIVPSSGRVTRTRPLERLPASRPCPQQATEPLLPRCASRSGQRPKCGWARRASGCR
jgi:Tol biopolymer transport system component